MDPDIIAPVNEAEAACGNGPNDGHAAAGENGDSFDTLNGMIDETTMITEPDQSSGSDLKIDDDTRSEEATEQEHIHTERNESTTSEVKGDSKPKQVKQKAAGKIKNEKSLGAKSVSSICVNKTKDGQGTEATAISSNGSHGLSIRPKQPTKSRSFNDRQPRVSRQPGNSDATLSDGSTDNAKKKPLKKGLNDKPEGVPRSLPKEEDNKPRKVGALPNYGFNFKCDERAEKRREFYSKLEEKIHAKEVEKSSLQAKSKESQEAEIKMFRKSLNFKATPMPTFYQEPPPPKVELKKIPTTRAKSPKLGRKKSASGSEPEENNGQSCRLARLSLDDRASDSNPIKAAVSVEPKKPQRKSLPKLPSQKTTLPNGKTEGKLDSAKAATSTKMQTGKITLSSKLEIKDDAIQSNSKIEGTVCTSDQSPIHAAAPCESVLNQDKPSAGDEEAQPHMVPEPIIV